MLTSKGEVLCRGFDKGMVQTWHDRGHVNCLNIFICSASMHHLSFSTLSVESCNVYIPINQFGWRRWIWRRRFRRETWKCGHIHCRCLRTYRHWHITGFNMVAPEELSEASKCILTKSCRPIQFTQLAFVSYRIFSDKSFAFCGCMLVFRWLWYASVVTNINIFNLKGFQFMAYHRSFHWYRSTSHSMWTPFETSTKHLLSMPFSISYWID